VNIKKGFLIVCFFFGAVFASAKDDPISADVVCLKTPTIKINQIVDNIANLPVQLCNRSDRSVSLIAAISPYAKQTQLLREQKRNGEKTIFAVKTIRVKQRAKKEKLTAT